MKKVIYASLAMCFILSSQVLLADASIVLLNTQMTCSLLKSTSTNRIKQTPYSKKLKKADLVISEIKKIGKVKVSADNQVIRVPVRITIKNNGKRRAGHFKIATEIFNPLYRSYQRIWFYSSGQSSPRPSVRVNLAPGQSTRIYGKLLFSKSFQGKNIRIRAKADDCSQLGRKSYCRVNESNERNNYSQTIRIVIPRHSI